MPSCATAKAPAPATTGQCSAKCHLALSLTPGQPYYVAVKARNAAGLWSEPGVSAGVIDGAELRTLYVPLVLRGKRTAPVIRFDRLPREGYTARYVLFGKYGSGAQVGASSLAT
jgi:hypothetical protein